MDELLAAYQEELNLHEALCVRIDHREATIAHVYRVTLPSQERYILKICRREGDFHRERYFLERLAGILPLPRLLQAVEPRGERRGALLLEDLGGHLVEPADWNEGVAEEIGELLARIHLNRTSAYGDLTQPDTLTPHASIYFGEKFQEELEESAPRLSTEWIKKCHRYFDNHLPLLEQVDGPCMIHRDFRPGNLILSEGKIKGIIDWSSSRSGFAEQDFSLLEDRQWPAQPRLKEALFAGYRSIRPLPDLSKILPLVQLGRALAVVGFVLQSRDEQGKLGAFYEQKLHFLYHFSF